MTSKSPNRNTFQKEGYLKRTLEKGDEPDPKLLAMWDDWNKHQAEQEQDPEWQKNNLEYDLRNTDWILEKARANDGYAQNIYAALCNMRWIRREMWPLFKEEYWSCSWRHAGGIVADMLQKGDYIDWYCSGMGGLNQEYEGAESDEQWRARTGYVSESTITEEIEKDLNKLGWMPSPWPEDDNI
jgi:hypothetical protein